MKSTEKECFREEEHMWKGMEEDVACFRSQEKSRKVIGIQKAAEW